VAQASGFGRDIRAYGAVHVAESIDAPATYRAFAESLDLDYPILSDPGKEVAPAWSSAASLGSGVRPLSSPAQTGQTLRMTGVIPSRV